MAERIERSKDGVPCWDGSSSTFQAYSEEAEHWEQTIPYHKRYLCGPRLLNELSGTAKRFVLSKRPGWVSHSGGVQTLLNHLRQHLGLPQLAEMSDFMNRYFKQSRRKKSESMNEYITRKAELYARAESTLGRAQEHYQPKSRSTTSQEAASRSSRTPLSSVAEGEGEYHETDEGTTTGAGADDPGNEEEETQSQRSWQDWGGWYGGGWYRDWQWSESQDAPSSSTWTSTEVQLLPEFVQGWLLLQDAGLEVNERNMILAAIKGDFRLERVAQELRNQWNDDDLRRRDQHGRGTAWMTKDDESPTEDEDGPDWANLAHAGLNAEGMALLSTAESEAQSALALIDQGRRTLKEARSKQKFVKLSRQYYGSRSSSTSGRSYQHGTNVNTPGTGVKCLSCGGSHKTVDCPKKNQVHQADVQEQAPFICMTDQVLNTSVLDANLATTHQAMTEGKAVIDGGATRTLGSVTALENLMNINAKQRGDDGMAKLDPEQRPVFGFGNSSSDRCLSTVWMKILAEGREGHLKVHTLDRGEGPILFSIETLRSLGAVIDFEHDLIVFRKLSDERIIQLERSSSGHQLLPLANDWYQGSRKTTTRVPSLKEFL